MTNEQNELCYIIKNQCIKAILNLDNEKVWEIIKDSIGLETEDNCCENCEHQNKSENQIPCIDCKFSHRSYFERR